jgi:hypothetical protein
MLPNKKNSKQQPINSYDYTATGKENVLSTKCFVHKEKESVFLIIRKGKHFPCINVFFIID